MPTVDEIGKTQGTPLAADLAAGLQAISYFRTVTFTQYIKLVLPLDGFVFWVKNDVLSPSAILNAATFGSATFGGSRAVKVPAPYVVAQGSLHYATDMKQEETETYTVNQVLFTTTEPLVDLNQVGPRLIYIAEIDGIRFAFSERGMYFKQSGLYHYRGAAVYSDMATQVIDALDGFDSKSLVVSNSLPAWLTLNGYNPIYNTFGNPTLTLYPSYALPPNLQSTTPFASVHIPPEASIPLQSTQLVGPTSNLWQLSRDRVRITTYGLRNREAMNFLACINQYSLDYDMFGIMDSGVVRDEKRGQVELDTLSMKKTIEFEVSYYQNAMNDIAQNYIRSVIPTFLFQ